VTLEALAVGIDQLEEIVASIEGRNAPPMQHREVLADHHDGIDRRIGARQGRQDALGRAVLQANAGSSSSGEAAIAGCRAERANQVHAAEENRGRSIETLGGKGD
jgi:hypothetical protein